ncbi:hypothetical protein MCHI_000208 [Candidatus Magnetoovum chiemensis]|nr:hypothetical protein MCHI_000208 [Candidatus Magnetoovum chiemensis]
MISSNGLDDWYFIRDRAIRLISLFSSVLYCFKIVLLCSFLFWSMR